MPKFKPSIKTNFRNHPIVRDRLFFLLLCLSITLAVSTIVALLLNIMPTSFNVPLRYSSTHRFDVLGPWYRLYVYVIFVAAVNILNVAIGIRAFRKTRMGSFLILIGTIAINLITLVISWSLTANVL